MTNTPSSPILPNKNAPSCDICENHLKLQWPPVCIAYSGGKYKNGFRHKILEIVNKSLNNKDAKGEVNYGHKWIFNKD